jgi:hypothetical protein
MYIVLVSVDAIGTRAYLTEAVLSLRFLVAELVDGWFQ